MWVVVVLLTCAVLVSAALVAFSWVAFRRTPGVPAKGVLVLKLQGDIEELSTNPFDSLLQEPVTMRSVTEALQGGQDRPAGHGRPAAAGSQAPALLGKGQELRDALVDFRTSGKPLVALLEFGGRPRIHTGLGGLPRRAAATRALNLRASPPTRCSCAAPST